MSTAKNRKLPLSSNELRALFLEYFRKQGHTVVASSPLVPGNDPTLLFTNAGMVQFKDVFLGKDKRNYVRAASSQRCVRAGGKHNDLENVGYTARHHTFFEMLGNFSFGDYFKRDAILFAWEFVTGKNWLGIDPLRLMVTVYQTDDEAYEVWNKEVGLAPDRIVRIGDRPSDGKPGGGGSDNFWQMGETGPCGPCSEIFYDHGPEIPGGAPGSADADGDRWIEIWNLVFMQFDRAADGQLTALPKPSVDTGMGLERLAAVMQGVHSNYEIDLFGDLIRAAAQVVGTNDLQSSSLRVIADHIRACSFLIVDGVLPSNEGRGYVLRRIIRRAIRHGYKLGVQGSFFYKLVAPLERAMGDAYSELSKSREHVERVLQQEELRFAETLATGMVLLEEAIKKLTSSGGSTIPGEVVFKLYDTYGFPVDLTADIARERGLAIDEQGFEFAMAGQRERARAASKFGSGNVNVAVSMKASGFATPADHFQGYDTLSKEGSVNALFKDGNQVEALREGEEGQVILDHTPFYAESGGQVGDNGVLSGTASQFIVRNTQKLGLAHVHIGLVTKGELKVGDIIRAEVNAELRMATALNHTATHLLHAALRNVLGAHVTQKGSLVAPDRLRFDFSHYQPVTADELKQVEHLVNSQIRANEAAETQVMNFDQAVAAGAMALFGEKYESDVRVLRVGSFSMELCGGTHVKRAGDIGFFKITAESGVAAGIRRIEAVTGEGALTWAETTDELLKNVAALVRGNRDDVHEKVEQLLERNRKLEKEVQQLKGKLASGQSTDLSGAARDIDGIKLIATRVDGADAKALREAVDQLKSKLKSAVIVLASVEADDKVSLIAGVTSDQTSRIKAGDLVAKVAKQIGGRGGGRPDMAQGGGNNPAALDAALASVEAWVRGKLQA